MYRKFVELLEKTKVSRYAVSKATGVSQALLSGWCNGKHSIGLDKLQKIADYFNVPITYFTEESDSAPAADGYYTNPETAEIAQEIFENRELRLLFDSAKDAEPSDLQTVHQMLLALKRKETPAED